MYSIKRQVGISRTLDVEAVERALADLWIQTAAESQSKDALLCARAANLMVFLPDRSMLAETHETIAELASIHPCRALVLTGDQNADTSDVEVYVSASCPIEKSSASRQLCCEEITLTAGGEFVSELPSAAIPLLLPDLETFLWWQETLRFDDKVFKTLLSAVDRLIVDSADSKNSLVDLSALAQVHAVGDEETAVSDINWERLTPWRASLSDFYDVAGYRAELDRIDRVRIDYVVQNSNSNGLAAQPLLIAGWLTSRLGWDFVKQHPPHPQSATTLLKFAKSGRPIDFELNPVPTDAVKPGSIVRVELERSGARPASFVISHSEDGMYLETSVYIGSESCPSRRVGFRSRTTAELLSREMEILCADKIYEEAIRLADRLHRRG